MTRFDYNALASKQASKQASGITAPFLRPKLNIHISKTISKSERVSSLRLADGLFCIWQTAAKGQLSVRC